MLVIEPADDWELVDMRLRKGTVHLVVTPVRYVTSMGTSYTNPVRAEKANGFEVTLRDGPSPEGAPAGTDGLSLVTFADVQDAWEFAAIATHYLQARSAGTLTVRIGDSRTGSSQPSGLVSDRAPLAVFEDLVGDDSEPIERFRA